MFNQTDQLAVNTIRALSVEQIEAANSGHPGLPLGAAPMAYALWAEHLRINPQVADWPNRDRFVLSAGHGSALLYSLLHLAGFDVSKEDLQNFRQLNSKTPGHPEYGHTHGVEATTGPLGQGIAQAVGMALAETHTASLYNTDNHTIIDHYTYALCGDGDLMEGVAYEAMSFAGHQKLGKLIVLYDSNDISLDGDLNMAFSENIQQRFESINWHYLRVEDGNDLQAVSNAIQQAKDHEDQPTLIEIKTVIGYGSPEAGTHSVHGAPLGSEGWQSTKDYYGYNYGPFEVATEVQTQFDERVGQRGVEVYQAWLSQYEAYKVEQPELAKQFEAAFNNELPEDYDAKLVYQPEDAKGDASRNASGQAIQAIAQQVPYFWGGSADLSGSNKTMIKNGGDFMPETRDGRNIWFGVREFAMAGMLNGIALHGGTRVYGGTFFVFTDYLKAAARLSALSGLPVTYVMTHDSVAVGEDGPTHEPIEHLAGFRAMPNLNLIRPADTNETIAAWKVALETKTRPTMLVLSRQNLPTLKATESLAEEGVRRGGYVISPSQAETPDGILIATGSEVAIAIEAQAVLAEKGYDVSVVSLPAMNLFDEQEPAYKETVLPSDVRHRMSIEMAASFGWERYVGLDGISLAIDRYGASGPASDVLDYFGFTVENVVETYINHFK